MYVNDTGTIIIVIATFLLFIHSILLSFLFYLSEWNCVVFNYVLMFLLLFVKGRQLNFLFKD